MTAAVRMTLRGRCHTAPPLPFAGGACPAVLCGDAADAERGIRRGRPAGERAAAQKSSRMAEDCGIFTIFAG